MSGLFFQLVSSYGQQREVLKNWGTEVRNIKAFVGQPLIDFPFSDLQPKLNHLKKEVVKGVSWGELEVQ